MAKITLKLPPLWENPEAEADQFRFIWSPKRISLAATGTKVGKTLGCAVWIITKALERKSAICWWVAPYRKTAKIGFNRVISMLPPGKVEINKTDLTIIFPHNGSRIEFRTAENPDTLFGDAITAVVVDEGGRIRPEAWTAIGSVTLQTQAQIRIASNTDKGKRNWLYREFMRGKAGDPEIDSWHIRTPDAPHFQEGGTPGPSAIESYRKSLPPLAFQAIVLAEFPDDAATVFPGLHNDSVLVESWNGESFDYKGLPFEFYFPPYAGGIFVGGLDLANRRDWTVITVIDAISGLVVYWARFQHVMWEEQLRKVAEVQSVYGCPFLVDSTPGSVGDPLIERLQLGGIMAEPFEFKNRTKQWIIERLAIDIQQKDVHIPAGLLPLIKEMDELEREISDSGVVKYSAPDGEGSHDDAVFSLALANWARGNIQVVDYRYEERSKIRGGITRRGFLGDGGRI
jgi:hypothetical protein